MNPRLHRHVGRKAGHGENFMRDLACCHGLGAGVRGRVGAGEPESRGKPAGEYSSVAGELDYAQREFERVDPVGVSRDGLPSLGAGVDGIGAV